MEMLIREYQKSDKDDLLKLLIYLQNFEQQLEPTTLAKGEDISKKFLELITNEARKSKGKIYVSEIDGKVVAFISGYVEEGPAEIELKDQKYFYISNIAVLPGFQKQGIGKRLLSKIEEYAKTLGIKLVLINVLNKNDKAYETYKKSGFRDYEKVLIKTT